MRKVLLISVNVVAAFCVTLLVAGHAHAATITVNNNGDTQADDGVCTLREAIVAANTDTMSGGLAGECAAGSGADTVEFDITGTASFTNDGQNGYTITLTGGLPLITNQLAINGYSQPGALENTAIAPQPLNGRLLIELNGAGIYTGMQLYADNSEVRGLVLNGAGGAGVLVGGDGIVIAGCYIGTDETGMMAAANLGNGINQGIAPYDNPTNLRIGGTTARDRNIVSGNDESGLTPNVGDNYWTVQGNYIGVGADGMTAIPNSSVYGPGGLSIDNSDGHVIGGSMVGATNVISGNNSFGIYPDNVTNLIIQGNIIGPDWKGEPIVNSLQLGGIGFAAVVGSIPNPLVGGILPGEGNLIAHNNGPGIVVLNSYANGNFLAATTQASILGNSIHDNISYDGFVLSQVGLGIDILDVDLSTFVITNAGPTLNDTGDADTGPNNYMNFPVLNAATQTGEKLEVIFDLDTADSPTNQYRVEFFSNDAADPSGYGEGQTYLGAITIEPGSGRTALLTLPPNLNLAGKVLSATATAVDNMVTSGFGSTSEFSKVMPITVTAQTSTALAETGENFIGWLISSVVLLLSGIAFSTRCSLANIVRLRR